MLCKQVKVLLVEAGPRILGSFDQTLVEYYAGKLRSKGVDVRTDTAVTRVESSIEHGSSDSSSDRGNAGSSENNEPHTTIAHFSDGSQLPFGMMVWSAGKFFSNVSITYLPREYECIP